MKIQCPCGAKYVIDVAPGMPPVQFICPACGQDYSPLVNEMIQRELAEIPVAAAAPAESPRLKIASHAAPPSAPPIPGSQIPRRRNPEERFAAEKKFWRKTGWILGLATVMAVLGIGSWTWYSWYGSVPHVYFSAKFDDISHSGSSFVNGDQIIFLHGGTLARYDMKTGKQIWAQQLVSAQQVGDELKSEDTALAAAMEKSALGYSRSQLPATREKNARIALEEQLSLHVAGKNVWVSGGEKLTRYDWESGKVLQTIFASSGGWIERGNELLAFDRATGGAPAVMRIDLVNGTVSTNEFQELTATSVAQNVPATGARTGGGLPLSPNASHSAMDPQRVAQQAQNLTTPARIALPAVIANNAYEQRLENELNDNGNSRQTNPQPAARPAENITLIPDGDGFNEFSSRLVRANFVQREAMKAGSGQSALDNVSGANESAAVNEQLNEMQRNNGNDKVTEDQSTYHVTVHKAGSQDAGWSGDVVGSPQLFPLKTVNVLTAGKTVVVLDKSNKKLWQAELTYNVSSVGTRFPSGRASYGDGPCVEHDGTLYVFDQAVLSAFDLSNGNARWRIPSVGIVGLFFDDKGMLYVNTTTGNPDDIKYARQIDVNKSTEAVFMKIDPAVGKILWNVKPGGVVRYVSGKFIYAVTSFDPGDGDEQTMDSLAGIERQPLTRIICINPSDGRILWQHDEARTPMNIQFDGSFIRIISKKDVEVLHYLAL